MAEKDPKRLKKDLEKDMWATDFKYSWKKIEVAT